MGYRLRESIEKEVGVLRKGGYIEFEIFMGNSVENFSNNWLYGLRLEDKLKGVNSVG